MREDLEGEPAVSVIVPARNAAATIRDTLAGLAEQELDGEYEVIVVDDGSSDGTAEIAAQASGPVSVVRRHGEGAAAARNAGAAAARARVLAFTDADCRPTRCWLAAGMRAIRYADIVQGRVEPTPDVFCRPFDRTIWIYEESGLYETANLFVTRSLFEQLGGFEAWLEEAGGRSFADDTWFGCRARRAGGKFAFEPAAFVHHAVIPRTPACYVRDRVRLAWFPAAVATMPELRELLFARYFLTRRTAAFDAAALGFALAAAARSSAPLACAVPYLVLAGRSTLSWRRRAPQVALVEPIAEAVGFLSLLYGSVRHRTLII